MYLRSIVAILEELIQTEAQIMLLLEGKNNGWEFMRKEKKNNYINGRKAFLLVQIT